MRGWVGSLKGGIVLVTVFHVRFDHICSILDTTPMDDDLAISPFVFVPPFSLGDVEILVFDVLAVEDLVVHHVVVVDTYAGLMVCALRVLVKVLYGALDFTHGSEGGVGGCLAAVSSLTRILASDGSFAFAEGGALSARIFHSGCHFYYYS